MKTSKDLETALLNDIERGKYKVNDKLPKENELEKFSKLSKMTVRKAIISLKEKEIVYTISGVGTFVSPFYKYSKFFSLKKKLNATSFTSHKSNLQKPKRITDYIKEGGYKLTGDKEIVVTRKYYDNKKIIAFSTNWINISNKKFKEYELHKEENNIINIKNFDKVVTVHTLEKSTPQEKKVFGREYEFLPTGFSYYFTTDRKILMTRAYKVRPEYFKFISINSRK